MVQSSAAWTQINYKQGMPFEKDQGEALPSCNYISVNNRVYVLQVPNYCLDQKGKMQNAIMHKLYPQFSNYDFASGQV